MTGLGCQPQDEESRPDIDLSWEITPDPPRVGMMTISVVLQDSAHRPIEDARVIFEGNMSHPGMQPVMTEAREAEPGVYTAQMDFSMAGDWFVLVTTTLKDSTVLEHQINLPGVRPRR